MANFKYKARDKTGTVIMGNMEAASTQAVGMELGRMGHFPVTIQMVSGDRAGTLDLSFPTRFNRIKAQDLVLFSRQMATLFNAGIPLLTILSVLGEQVENPRFKGVIAKIRQDVTDGQALSEAMAKHPDVFSELYVSLVQAGESGGIMDEILARLADLLEAQEENKAKIKAALLYPQIVIVAMFLAISFLMWKVVPVFVSIFETVKLELPLPTHLLILGNDMVQNYWYYPVIVLAGGYFLFKRFISVRAGRYQWDLFKLKLPLLGPIFLRSSMSKFARVFGTLLRGGVPILEVISISSRVVDNAVISEMVGGLSDSVQEGQGVTVSLRESEWVPALVVQMVGAGEESGTLDDMLIKVADYYDQEVDRAIKTLSLLIEPILIVCIGVLVLFLALSIFMPMWDMAKMARRG